MRQHEAFSLGGGFCAQVEILIARSALEVGHLEHEVIAQRNSPRNIHVIVGLRACFQTSHQIFLMLVIPFDLFVCLHHATLAYTLRV